jgi:hypothetical protein
MSLIIPSHEYYTEDDFKIFFEDRSNNQIMESIKESNLFTLPNGYFKIYFFIFLFLFYFFFFILVVKELQQAIELLELCKLYEYSQNIHIILNSIYMGLNNYRSISLLYEHVGSMFYFCFPLIYLFLFFLLLLFIKRTIPPIHASSIDTRVRWTFYRIGYYGLMFKEERELGIVI